MHNFLNDNIFEERTTAGLQWLKRSIDVTGMKGSAAYYSRWRKPFKGWEAAYPETTGYIIETLFDYYHLRKENWLFEYAISCSDWLISIQSKEGYFKELLGNTYRASVFNTGQIIFGLVRAYEETGNEKYLQSFEKTVQWLIDNLEQDGSWQAGNYIDNFIPAYYTRVIWAILYANKFLNKDAISKKMELAFAYNLQNIQPNLAINNWGFWKNKPAFTHTIAYTLRGFLESSIYLKDKECIKTIEKIGKNIIEIYPEGNFPGTIDLNWKGDFSYICVTGNAQISSLFYKLYLLESNNNYGNYASKVFEKTYQFQKLDESKNLKGAVPGSAPFWGKYMRMKYPNWAVKFYLDAYLGLWESKNI